MPNLKLLSKRNWAGICLLILGILACIASILFDQLTVFRTSDDEIYASCSWTAFSAADKEYECNNNSTFEFEDTNNTYTDSDSETDTNTNTPYPENYDFLNTNPNGTYWWDFESSTTSYMVSYPTCVPHLLTYSNSCDNISTDWCNTETAGYIWLFASISGILFVLFNICFNLYDKPMCGGFFGCLGWLGLILGVFGWIGIEFNFTFNINGNPICFNEESEYLMEDATLDIGDSLFIMFGAIVLTFAGWVMSCLANLHEPDKHQKLRELPV